MKIRTFIGVEIPPASKDLLLKCQGELQREIPSGVKWVTRDCLHLTVKFIGEVATERIVQVSECAAEICAKTPCFSFVIRSLGMFGRSDNPRVIWVGAEGAGEILQSLYLQFNEKLLPITERKEKNRYNPHVTIGRVKRYEAEQPLDKLLELYRENEFGTVPVQELVLFQSELKPHGPVYNILERFALAKN